MLSKPRLESEATISQALLDDSLYIEPIFSDCEKVLKTERYIGSIEDLTEFDEYPFDNQYLLTGWRIHYFKWTDCFASLFQWHNETLNIWTHLLGSLFFMALIIYFSLFYHRTVDFYKSMILSLYESGLPLNLG
jgi:hypothetical protein